MSNLIVARFDDAHSALLARAALARLQRELSLSEQDIAVVTREEGCEIVLHQAIGLGTERQIRPTYWEILVSLLFDTGPSAGAGGSAAAAKLAPIGIDAAFRSHFAEQGQAETSALLVSSTGPVTRDKVLGVLRGFQGKIVLAELTGEDREVWRRTLIGTKQTEKMK